MEVDKNVSFLITAGIFLTVGIPLIFLHKAHRLSSIRSQARERGIVEVKVNEQLVKRRE